MSLSRRQQLPAAASAVRSMPHLADAARGLRSDPGRDSGITPASAAGTRTGAPMASRFRPAVNDLKEDIMRTWQAPALEGART